MIPHWDNLWAVLVALGIIGFIAGVLWLAGCQHRSTESSISFPQCSGPHQVPEFRQLDGHEWLVCLDFSHIPSRKIWREQLK